MNLDRYVCEGQMSIFDLMSEQKIHSLQTM